MSTTLEYHWAQTDPIGKAMADAADQALTPTRREQRTEQERATLEHALSHYIPQAAAVSWAAVPMLLKRIPSLPTADELKSVLAALAAVVGQLDCDEHVTGYDDVQARIDLAHEAVDNVVNTWGEKE